MDRERFDALARLFATTGSRRSAIGALLGAGVLGTSLEADARKGNSRNKRRDKGKDKSKKRNSSAQAEQLPARCCSTGNCTPGKGKNLGKCCYLDDDVSNRNFSGANLGSANLTRADASGSNFKGANLGKACLVDTILTDAKINNSTNLGGAIFCRTTMPDGSVNDSGCNRNTRCCETCIEEGAVCDGIGGECCPGSDCCGEVCIDTQTDNDNCGECGNVCTGQETCQNGECVIVVSPANLRGWVFVLETPPVGIVAPTFESGPGNPPFGDGSAELVVEITGAAPNGEGKLLAADIFAGAHLADFDTLAYTVYVTSADADTAPSLQLGIDFDSTNGINGFQGRMVYVPNANGPFPQGSWETIDALADNGGGNWFFTCQAAVGACQAGSGGLCPLGNPCNFSEILTAFPNIRINTSGPGLSLIGFKVGAGEGDVDANVDSIRIQLDGDARPTIYTFEENP